MKKPEIKTHICTIMLIVMLTISAILVVLPSTFAQEPDITKTTTAYIGATPNPTGVNQEVLLHVGITDFLRRTHDSWEGITVTVKKPDGTTETLGPFTTDATGGTGAVLIPDQVGTYTLQTHFPEQMYTWENPSSFAPGLVGDVLYLASDSEELQLVVTEEPREYWPQMPLPTEYWTRPIDAQLREWSVIAGSWPDGPLNGFRPYNEYSPDTGHILWTKPIAMGGLVGGDLGFQSMECGAAYEQKGYPPIILNGILYFNKWEERGGETRLEQEVVAVNLHTGEELWSRPLIDPDGINRRLDFGQLFYWDSYNFHGTFAYLWAQVGSTWHAFDAFTGRWVYTMENVTGGNNMYGPKGEIYKYIVDLNDRWLALWNSSRVVSDEGSWRAHGRIFDAKDGIEWNVTIPEGLEFQEFYPYTASVTAAYYGDRIIGSTAGGYQRVGHEPVSTWSVSTKPGHEGELIFVNEWLPPQPDLSIAYAGGSIEDGVFVLRAKETRQYWGFDIDTGEEIWGPTESENYMHIYGTSNAIAYGNFYSTYMSGIIYCYDIKTGQLKWTYENKDELGEMLWANNYPLRIPFVTDGKLFLYHGEHSPIDPKPRGGMLLCLDAETGDVIWEFDSMYFYYRSDVIIGDSIIAILDSYDQRFYGIGKGPSETTVSIQNDVSTLNRKVLVTGTVMDVSPGTKETALTARFPKGVPAVADEDMSEWMKYVHQQFPRPNDVSGVQVKIEAVDPNNNYQNYGTTTTDSYGNFGFAFEPEVPGTYMIIATFEGSDSYYASTDTAYLEVEDAPAPSTPIEPEEPTEPEEPATEVPLISTEIAIIAIVVVIAVLGVAAYWVMRKRK